LRSSASAWLLLAGCNQLLGSAEVGSAPARVFDAPLDAPFACPELGAPPHYSPYLHQLPITGCTHYSESAGSMIADCVIDGTHTVMEGPIGGELAVAPGVETASVPLFPRLTPDGQHLLIHVSTQLYAYTRQGDSWGARAETNIFLGDFISYSTIARQGSAERIILEGAGAVFDEYEHQGDVWTRISSTPHSQYGFTGGLGGMAMTSDGRRLVISGPAGTFYTDRASFAEPFRIVDTLEAPGAYDVFITDDCARIYVSGLGSIFYAQQR
jgi:hypothetical protein